MRGYSARLDRIPVPADTHTLAVLAANTPQSFDYPASMDVVRLSGATTSGSSGFAFTFNPLSTFAVWGSSFSNTTASSGQNILVGDSRSFQITGGATGFSLSAGQAGVVGMEFWKSGG